MLRVSSRSRNRALARVTAISGRFVWSGGRSARTLTGSPYRPFPSGSQPCLQVSPSLARAWEAGEVSHAPQGRGGEPPRKRHRSEVPIIGPGGPGGPRESVVGSAGGQRWDCLRPSGSLLALPEPSLGSRLKPVGAFAHYLFTVGTVAEGLFVFLFAVRAADTHVRILLEAVKNS